MLLQTEAKYMMQKAIRQKTFDGSISARGARKAADFVKFCDAFDIPVLTLTNATGFKATCMQREDDGEICRRTGCCICRRNSSEGKRESSAKLTVQHTLQ